MELDKEEDEFYELGHVKVEEEGHQWTENKVSRCFHHQQQNDNPSFSVFPPS